MATQDHNASLLDLLPDTIIELYEMDLGEQDGVYRFHPGTINGEVLFFDSLPYYPLPVQASEFDKRADGQMPRPSLGQQNIWMAAGLYSKEPSCPENSSCLPRIRQGVHAEPG